MEHLDNKGLAEIMKTACDYLDELVHHTLLIDANGNPDPLKIQTCLIFMNAYHRLFIMTRLRSHLTEAEKRQEEKTFDALEEAAKRIVMENLGKDEF